MSLSQILQTPGETQPTNAKLLKLVMSKFQSTKPKTQLKV